MTALRKTRGVDAWHPDGAASGQARVAQIWSAPPAMTDEALARISERVKVRLAETAATDRAALRAEAECARWEASERDSVGDPYFCGERL